MTTKRSGNKWSINEILRLQREYELLELSCLDMAKLHRRSEEAIMYKLHEEGFLDELKINKNCNTRRKNRDYMKLRSYS